MARCDLELMAAQTRRDKQQGDKRGRENTEAGENINKQQLERGAPWRAALSTTNLHGVPWVGGEHRSKCEVTCDTP